MKIIYRFDGINVIYEINIGSPNLNLLSTDIRCEHLTPPPFSVIVASRYLNLMYSIKQNHVARCILYMFIFLIMLCKQIIYFLCPFPRNIFQFVNTITNIHVIS